MVEGEIVFLFLFFLSVEKNEGCHVSAAAAEEEGEWRIMSGDRQLLIKNTCHFMLCGKFLCKTIREIPCNNGELSLV